MRRIVPHDDPQRREHGLQQALLSDSGIIKTIQSLIMFWNLKIRKMNEVHGVMGKFLHIEFLRL